MCLWHLRNIVPIAPQKFCAYCTSKTLCLWHLKDFVPMAPPRIVVYNLVDSCPSSTSNKSSSSFKDIGEGGAGSAGKGGKTATGPVGSGGPGRNWGAGSQAGDKGENSAVGSDIAPRLRCETRLRLTAAKPGCEAAKVRRGAAGRGCGAGWEAAKTGREAAEQGCEAGCWAVATAKLGLGGAEREACAFPKTLSIAAVDVNMLFGDSVVSKDVRDRAVVRGMNRRTVCVITVAVAGGGGEAPLSCCNSSRDKASNRARSKEGILKIQALRACSADKSQTGKRSRTAWSSTKLLPIGSRKVLDERLLTQGEHMHPTNRQITVGKAVFKAIPRCKV